jgi:hypothetical protein
MKNLLFITISIIFMACNSSSKQKRSEISESEVEKIRIALTQLIKKENSDAFVIFTDVNSGKFVQFAGSVNEDLYFSLPASQLNQNELSIAKEKLKKYNIHLNSFPMYTDETMEYSLGTMEEFSKSIGRDVEIGVKITITILTEIFELEGDIQLIIEEN